MKTGACLTTVTNLRGPAGPGRKVRGSEKAPRLPRHVLWESRYFREKQRATKRDQKRFVYASKKPKTKRAPLCTPVGCRARVALLSLLLTAHQLTGQQVPPKEQAPGRPQALGGSHGKTRSRAFTLRFSLSRSEY